jgi:hypothetical protein
MFTVLFFGFLAFLSVNFALGFIGMCIYWIENSIMRQRTRNDVRRFLRQVHRYERKPRAIPPAIIARTTDLCA